MEGSGCDQHGGHHRVLLRVLVEQDNGLGPTHPDLTGAELPPPLSPLAQHVPPSLLGVTLLHGSWKHLLLEDVSSLIV